MGAAGFNTVAFATVVVLSSLISHAYDNSPLQDFCVAVPDTTAAVFVNGRFCKNPKLVTADDFLASGLSVPANTSNNPLGFGVTVVDVNRIPGLNTLGLNLMRFDFAPNGVVPPHFHPRASEIMFLLEGTLHVGFVTSNPTDGTKNRLIEKILKPGDVFVFPVGLVHFARNVGKAEATGIVVFNSQNPGFTTIAKAAFGTEPPIENEVLTISFQLDKKTIDYLLSRSW